MMKVPLCRPAIDEKELNLVREVLESGWLAHGPKVKQFEEMFAEYVGTKYAVSLNSCAAALQVAIMSERSESRKEVILPSFTFPASANAIMNAGCTPIFADIRSDTLNIDIEDLERKITPRTVAVMPVHFAGQSCDMDGIMKLADQYDLEVVEDSAEAIGSTWNGRRTGSFGIGCFSFYPTKNITTGEGGMVTTNDESVAKYVKTVRGHGISTGAHDRASSDTPWARVATMPGYNFRMSEIAAAIGIVQMGKLDDLNRKRRTIAEYFSREFSKIDGVLPPVEHASASHSYQMYVIQVEDEKKRDSFVRSLRERGVEASVHFYPAVHLHDFYAQIYGYDEGDLPVTEMVSKRVVTLPMFPTMTEEQSRFVVESVKDSLEHVKRL